MPRLFGFPQVPIPGPRALPLVGAPLKFYRFLDDPLGAVLGLREHGDVAAIAGGNPAMVVRVSVRRSRAMCSSCWTSPRLDGLTRSALRDGSPAGRVGAINCATLLAIA